jgi:phage terminase small subunit
MSKQDNTYGLTQQQIKFCHHYLETGNGTASAKAAGYGESGAHVRASTLLKNSKVQKYLEDLRDLRRQEIMNKFASYAEDAIREMYTLMLNEETPEAVRLNAMKEILDRAGYKPAEVKKVENNHEGEITFSFIDPNSDDE